MRAPTPLACLLGGGFFVSFDGAALPAAVDGGLGFARLAFSFSSVAPARARDVRVWTCACWASGAGSARAFPFPLSATAGAPAPPTLRAGGTGLVVTAAGGGALSRNGLSSSETPSSSASVG